MGLRFFQLFILVMFFQQFALAQFFESLAQLASPIVTDSCKSILATAKNASSNQTCNSNYNNFNELQKFSKNTNEDLLFAKLCKLRSLKNDCALEQLNHSFENIDDKNVFEKDFKKKIAKLATEVSDYARLQHQLQLAQASDKKFDLKPKLAELQKRQARIASIENSIPFGGALQLKELIAEVLRDITEKSMSLGAINSTGDIEIKEIEPVAFSKKYAAAITLILKDLQLEKDIYQSCLNSGGSSLNRNFRESMAQDRDLLTELAIKDSSFYSSYKDLCLIDARYGAGAQRRDELIFAGSVVLTFASAGIGFLGRTAFFATTTSSVRAVAARGLLPLQVSRALGIASMGLNTTLAVETFDSCFQDEAKLKINTKNNQCFGFTVEDLETQNCVADLALSALGGSLSTKKVQTFLTKRVSKLANAAAVREDEVNRMVEGSQQLSSNEKLIGRALSRDELSLLERKSGETTDQFYARLRSSNYFAEPEIFRLIKAKSTFEATPRTRYDFYLSAVIRANKEKGITSASLDRPGERKFKKLEEQMVKDENKFIFKDQADQDKFFYFRNLNKENLTAIYEEEPSFHKILTETKYDPRKLIEGEYNRILNVAENLGTEKFASFNSKFGHIDTQENSNIFSLRLKPVTNYDSEKNKILVEVNPRMRALLCKQTDGKIRVLQIYNKDSFIDSVGFAEYEKDLFQKARDKIKAEKINCLKPKP